MNMKHFAHICRLQSACALLVLALCGIVSCGNDDDASGETYFELENNETSFEASSSKAQFDITVRSNRSWNIVSRSENADWVRPFPAEGDQDGIFHFIVSENKTFESRMAQFAMIVNGEEYPVLLNVSQEAATPYITVGDGSGTIKVASDAGQTTITTKANVNWTCAVDPSAADWLKVASLSDDGVLTLEFAKNNNLERTGVLHCTSAEQPTANKDINVVQAAGSIILQEDFSWLTSYGQLDGVVDPPYTTDRQVRIDKWTDDEKAHGWTSTVVGDGGGNTPLLYACYGYVKLGKTNYAGDLISPKLSLEEATDVTVTFKATGYISAGGAKDDNVLCVSVIGPGTLVCETNPFTISNYPNSKKNENGDDYDPWDASIAERSFKIKGATGETQIKFMAGSAYTLKGVGQGKNRIFIDDITVSKD